MNGEYVVTIELVRRLFLKSVNKPGNELRVKILLQLENALRRDPRADEVQRFAKLSLSDLTNAKNLEAALAYATLAEAQAFTNESNRVPVTNRIQAAATLLGRDSRSWPMALVVANAAKELART